MPVFKLLFEFVTDQLTLFDNSLYNYIAMGVLAVVAFSVAFKFVGFLYKLDIISGKASGSLIHWSVRLLVFLILYILVTLIILLVRLIITIPTTVWLILLTIGSVSIVGYMVRQLFVKR